MSRRVVATVRPVPSFPRVSGDEPARTVPMPPGLVFSPRERG